MRRDLALARFRSLTPDEQKLCRAAIPYYAASLKRRNIQPRSFHLWIRSRGFSEFPSAKLQQEQPAPSARRLIQGDELIGFAVAMRIAERRDPVIINDRDHGAGVWTLLAQRPDLVALAQFADVDRGRWTIVDEGSEPYAAWRGRLALWLGAEPRPERIPTEPHRPGVHDLPASHPGFKLRKARIGFLVPRLWPPRPDGSWPAETT